MRKKSHEIKPMFVEDAIEQMEMLGHDFFFFLYFVASQMQFAFQSDATVNQISNN